MVLCLGTTPAVQRVMIFRQLTLDAVNRAATTLDGAAGKAINVAKVLKVLGETPLATGFLGGDRGEFIRAVLSERGIESEFVTVSARTRQCLTVIDESTGTHTELVEEGRAVAPADHDRLMEIVRRHVANCRAVVMSGTITAGVPADLYAQVARLAHAASALALADAQGVALLELLPAQPDLVKPNRPELAGTLKRPLTTETEIEMSLPKIGCVSSV